MGEKADLILYTKGEEQIKIHSLVLFVRCKDIFNEIIEENDSKKILSWPNISKNVAKSFFKFLYSGKLELELESPQEFQEVQYLCKNYPSLKTWVSFIENINFTDFGGFIDENDELPVLEGGATQNLSQLLELLEEDKTEDSTSIR